MLKNANSDKGYRKVHVLFTLISLKDFSEVTHKPAFSEYPDSGIFGIYGHYTVNIMQQMARMTLGSYHSRAGHADFQVPQH